MAEPSFNAVNIFGPCPSSNRIELPNARQSSGYPGVVGLETLELGWRGSYTEFRGLWVEEDPDDLGAFIGSIVALKRAGGFATLVDTRGLSSPDAVLEGFETEGESQFCPGHGWAVAYRMRFLHLGFAAAQGP